MQYLLHTLTINNNARLKFTEMNLKKSANFDKRETTRRTPKINTHGKCFHFWLGFLYKFHDFKLCSMNVIKIAAKTVGIICVPIAFVDHVGSIGFVEGTSMEVNIRS
jgi:hypothetical protein